MSNGDDENPEPPADDDEEPPADEGADETPAEDGADESPADGSAEQSPEDDGVEARVAAFEDRLDDVDAALEAAETEADLDEVESDLDAIEAEIEDADLTRLPPEAEDDDGDDEEDEEPEPEDLSEGLLERVDDLRSDLEDQRGPYAEDVASAVDGSAGTVRSTRWAEEGVPEVRAAVESFLESAGEILDTTFEPGDGDLDAHATAIEAVGEAATGGEAGEPLDPDADADTIAALLDAVEDLDADLEDATAWSDLEVVEQLSREGFYDRLTPKNHKDFPPERNVVRIAEREGDVERILLAFEHLDSDFMEERCVEAIKRLGAAEAFEAMHGQAQRRQVGPIEALGKIGDDRAVETLVDFVDGNNLPVQKASLRALGEIGSETAAQAVANVLDDDSADVRSRAARSLGLIGDPRAVDPLEGRLADDEEDASVRASAAWALVQIGTEAALTAAADYADDPAYTVQAQAERARDAVDAETTAA